MNTTAISPPFKERAKSRRSNMRREERRRKRHEGLLQTLYPPSVPPEEEEKVDTSNAPLTDVEHRNEGDADNSSEGSSCSRDYIDEGEGESETQKRTRAQRKRIRKKKLREDARRRGKMIGPLLPQAEQKGPQGVRQNAAEDPVGVNINLIEEDPAYSCTQRRVKQRRMAKKMARDGSRKEDLEL